ncbi:hypothetical protein CDAR_592371 [Caerostris darwini]|uniref:Uncharacterized protein n=1 Tax=Caerostris darwini TaxID=1538125 RepID=A0AAV4TJF2_9ARAC|nr:hypothetical protein CDAR_592371 [Caerostris darwini]
MQWCVSYCISRLLLAFTGLYCDSRLGWMPSASWDGCPFLSTNESVIAASETERTRLDLRCITTFLHRCSGVCLIALVVFLPAFAGLYCDSRSGWMTSASWDFLSKNESVIAAWETERGSISNRITTFVAQMQWRVSYCISRLLRAFNGLHCDSRLGWMPSASWDGSLAYSLFFPRMYRLLLPGRLKERGSISNRITTFFAQMQWRVSYCISRLLPVFYRSLLRFSVRLDAICFVGWLSRLFPFLSKNESVTAASETERTRLHLRSQYDFLAQMQWRVSYCISRLSSCLHRSLLRFSVRLDTICFVGWLSFSFQE